MSILPFMGIIEKIFDRVIPDPEHAAAAKLEAAKLAQAGDLAFLDADVKIALAQANITLEESKSDSLFKSGWRPAIGWTCTVGFIYQFVLQPVLAWASINFGWVAPPVVDTGTLVSLLVGMLGLAGIRSFDKIQGK